MLLLFLLTVAVVNKAPKVTAGTAPKALVPSATSPTSYPADDFLNALKASDPDNDKVYISAVSFPANVPRASIRTLTTAISGGARGLGFKGFWVS